MRVAEHILIGGSSVFVNRDSNRVSINDVVYTFAQVRELARVSARAGGGTFRQIVLIIDDYQWVIPIIINTN